MKRLGLFMALQLIAAIVFGQFSLTGIVKDSQGETLSGANVMLKNTFNRTTAGIKGDFKFSNLSKGEYTIAVTFVGYKNFSREIKLTNSSDLELVLEPASVLTEEVLVSAARAGEKSPLAYTNIGK